MRYAATGQKLITLIATCCLAGWLVSGQQDVTILDEQIKPFYFENLLYPLAARLTHVQGVVVVRVTLGEDGRIVSSQALSGAKSLIADCIANSKKWRFQPSSAKTAIIVYDFKIEGLCNLPCASQCTFRPPNMVTIVIGEGVVDHSG